MRIWVTLHKGHKIIARSDASSDLEDSAEALMDCLEQVYKRLDLAEPVWVSKHAKELYRLWQDQIPSFRFSGTN